MNERNPKPALQGVPERAGELTFSRAEERFDRWRRTTGLFIGPAVLVAVWLLPMPALSPEAHRLAAVVSLVVVWWITEAIPIPVTALIGTALAVAAGVAPAQEAFAPFASPVIFLFIGSFIIGRAISEHRLDRRLAYALLSRPAVKGSLTRVALSLAALTAVLSAWISNTATSAMMLPIALGILGTTGRTAGGGRLTSPFLLAIAYGASIGGVMTPVGTPPNLITIGLLDKLAGVRIDFFTWMLLSVPIALTVLVCMLALTGGSIALAGSRRPAHLAEEPAPGKWTAGQRNAAIAFGLAVVLWIGPGLVALLASPASVFSRLLSARLDEAVVAILAACLLFALPVDWKRRRFTLDWTTAARIDWGTILLFGGGLSLGRLMFTTGLAAEVGAGVVAVSGAQSLWAITAVAIALSIVLTEVASNTAATNMLVPVVISICHASGLNPVPPAVGVAIGASMAFMLPVATPPNAIMYGSGLLPITVMARYGVVMNILSFTVTFLGLRLLAPLLGFG
jgi:solute carrier family 13 (sodium-dependent dicarboxylate transporter), member 2/3/5